MDDTTKKNNQPLCHYTKSNVLKPILQDGYISMRASCVCNFWNEEVNEYDDNQEFILPLQLLNLEKLEIRERDKLYKNLRDRYHTKEYINSTLTPYIVCFSKSLNDQELYRRFCSTDNKNQSVTPDYANDRLSKIEEAPVMLKFEFDESSVLDAKKYNTNNDTSKGNEERGIQIERVERIEIEYADSSNGITGLSNAYHNALKKITDLNICENKAGDNALDACLFVKRDSYKVENEVRYVFRILEPYEFRITDDKKPEFLFYNTDSCNSNATKHILIKIKPECLKEIRFGPGVDKKTAKNIIDQLEHLQSYSCVKVLLFDGTPVITI